jgi:aminoglycoside phosphotransferase (APT) family kinase protein
MLVAILDWEMATLGDPMCDLGLLLVYWDPLCAPILIDGHPVSAAEGFPSVDCLVELYANVSGRSVERINFYRALGYFKLAVIAEGIHSRYEARLTVGPGFESVGSAVGPLTEVGLQLLPP